MAGKDCNRGDSESDRNDDSFDPARTIYQSEDSKKAFNVAEKVQHLTYKEHQCLRDQITIQTLNMGWLRTKYKKEFLNAMAYHLKFNIGVITETNLLESETDAIKIKEYRIVDKMGTSKHRGGVLILADHTVDCRGLDNIQKPQFPIDACSFIAYPTGSEDYRIRITGVYIPPCAETAPRHLRSLVDPDHQTHNHMGERISNLLVGDFNPNC